jgi:hypothetical protein
MMGIGTKPALIYANIGRFDVVIPDKIDLLRIKANPHFFGKHSQKSQFSFFIELALLQEGSVLPQ